MHNEYIPRYAKKLSPSLFYCFNTLKIQHLGCKNCICSWIYQDYCYNTQCLILHQFKLMAKLSLILVIQQRIFRIAHASFGSTMTMITCVITVIVHTITGWVSNCLSKISCSTCMYTHSTRLCKYSTAQSIATSVLATEIMQKRALSVAVGMWDREAYVYVAVV